MTSGFGDVISGDVISSDIVSGDATSGDVIYGDATSGDVIYGDATSGDVTIPIDPPHIINGWCIYTTERASLFRKCVSLRRCGTWNRAKTAIFNTSLGFNPGSNYN